MFFPLKWFFCNKTKQSMAAKKSNRLKLELEYPLRSSANILYQYISTPSGLQSWFADHVEVAAGAKYRFKWEDGTESRAVMVRNVTNKYVKFNMEGSANANEYMEFRIDQDDITGDVELIITEFVNEGEEEMAASIWDAAIDSLCNTIGA